MEETLISQTLELHEKWAKAFIITTDAAQEQKECHAKLMALMRTMDPSTFEIYSQKACANFKRMVGVKK